MKMDRTTARRIYNEFTSEVDINRPDGILRSSDVDAYIEKALKPLIEEGKAFKQVSVDRRAGIRSTRYSYQGGKNIQDSINAILAEMPASLGYDVDPVTGNVSGTDKPPPMSVTNQGRRYYNEIRERILDPRAAAAIRADALRAGGIATTDKASGYTTTLIRAGLSGETRKMLKLVDDTDAKYLAGELPSSALADGASPATIEERARAQVSRQANLKDAKQAAIEDYITKHPDSPLAFEEAIKFQRVMNREDKQRILDAERTPGTKTFKERVFQNIRAREETAKATEEFIRLNPFSSLARQKQKRRWEQRKHAVKRGISGAAHLSRNALVALITGILGATLSGVSLLAKAFAAITDIGQNVRRQVINDTKLNFDAGTTRGWERFAEKRGFGKDTLASAAGGIMAAWGNPLNYNDGNFNALAPYLKGGTKDLVRMASSGGDKNILKIMSMVIDDLVGFSIRGVAGTHDYSSDQSGRTAAFAENAGALSAHNAAWGELMQMYWNDLQDPDSEFKKIAAAAGQDTGFESWVTQGTWNPEFKETGNGISNMTVQQAAVKTMEAVSSLKGSLNSLKNDALERVVGSIAQTVEDFRSTVVNLLSYFFPVFAMKEQERAVFLNTQAQIDVERNIAGSKVEAEAVLKSAGYTGGTEGFRPIFEKLKKGDISAFDETSVTNELIEKLISDDNSILLSTLANYYNDASVKERLERESKNIEAGKNAAVVVYNPSSNGTRISSDVMRSQMTLDRISKTWLPLRSDTSVQFDEIASGLGIGILNIPGEVTRQWSQKLSDADIVKLNDTYRRQRIFIENMNEYPNGSIMAGVLPGTHSFKQAEDAIHDRIRILHDLGRREDVVQAYNELIDFYQKYGHFARITDSKKAAELRERIRSNSEGLLFGDNLRRLAQTFAPSELVEVIRSQIGQYQTVSSRDTALPARSQRQTADNTYGHALSLRQQISTGMSNKGILDDVYTWIRNNLPGEQRSIFVDVDEQALKENRAAVTNVYLDFGNGKRIQVLSQKNTGVQRDRRVLMDDDVLRALTEAFSATQ
jgi:hypothetical protein